jgi:hypothetical protein
VGGLPHRGLPPDKKDEEEDDDHDDFDVVKDEADQAMAAAVPRGTGDVPP